MNHIDIYYEPSNINYVFTTIDPSNTQNWIFSCSCYYNYNELIYIPRYNFHDPIWNSETFCISNFHNICQHTQKCLIAKLSYQQYHLFNIDIPNWCKKMFNPNYLDECIEIVNDLNPIKWAINSNRYSIGKTKIQDFTKINVYQNNLHNWTCTCNNFINHNFCIHISKSKYKDYYLHNRIILCIRLAQLYFENNI